MREPAIARVFLLRHEAARADLKRALDDPAYWDCQVSFQPVLKSRAQEQKYHAMIAEIAAQYSHCGRQWDADDMKRLLLDQFRRDTVNDPELGPLWRHMGTLDMVPALDGTGVVMLGTASQKFPQALASALITWLYAFAAENRMVLTQ